MYQNITAQPNRLGSFEEFGGEASAIVNSLATATVGVTQAIVGGKTSRIRARAGRDVALAQARAATEQAGIATRGATEQAAIDVERVRATYGTIAKLVVGVGASLAVLLIAGGFSYKLATKGRKKR